MDENTLANNLAQQASDFRSNRGKFGFRPMQSATICSAEPSSTKLEGLEFSGFQTNQVKQQRPILMIGEHPWYVI
jgi:hypothetical protein